jgi:hypothetical protein
MFILAHEFGHIVLGHLGHKSLTKTQKLQFEREADQFAYEAMLQVLQSEEESSTVGDLWTAVRWLYQYQLLDEIVGNLLANEDVVLDDLWLQQRKIDKPSLFPKDMSREDNVLECRGTMMLMSLKHELINLGREFLKLVSDELSTLEPGPNSSWWTKIANSGTSYVDPQFKGVGRTNDK